ncbi:PREDICTED: UPF0528 protein CG10038 isoform X1 [Polistes canadensis]|uniref:UPF0528 protein CG10038 isoform X1 n=1 Tax=Polistes canadensis TaxID=91411 RepID=UPI000718B05E|nr:PREDICTED: UPF0528 protein CG10038 isoform X1 [Polistes canadensis]
MLLRKVVRKTSINVNQCFPQCSAVKNALLGMTKMEYHNFPKSLKEFGYDFNTNGQLRKINAETGKLTNEGFEFKFNEDSVYNQKRYEALGEVINEYVYSLLEKEGLIRLPIPKESSEILDKRSFIFASEDALENEKVIVLIHGSGVVRAGQWARRLIINDCLNTGTQIPYVKKAKELGYGLFVLNTNDNSRIINGKSNKIKGSEGPHEHLRTAWYDYIGPSKSKYVAIVAHSFGGECVVQFAMEHVEEFTRKVFAVGLTDSVHSAPFVGFSHVVKVSRNWICSDKPLDAPMEYPSEDIQRVSAGHKVHELSSSACINSLFRFIEERYESTRDELKT